MKKLVIVGAGETAHLAYEYFTHDSPYEVCAFSVHSAYRKDESFLDLPLVDLEKLPTLYSKSDYEVFVALASEKLNYNRTRLYNELRGGGINVPLMSAQKRLCGEM